MLQDGASRSYSTITCVHNIEELEAIPGYPRSRFISADGVKVRYWKPAKESEYAGQVGVECWYEGCDFHFFDPDKKWAQYRILDHIYTLHGE